MRVNYPNLSEGAGAGEPIENYLRMVSWSRGFEGLSQLVHYPDFFNGRAALYSMVALDEKSTAS